MATAEKRSPCASSDDIPVGLKFQGFLCKVLLSCALLGGAHHTAAQEIQPQFRDQLQIADIGSPWFSQQTPSRITQMAWHSGPGNGQNYLYFSSMDHGIRRVTYDTATANFVPNSLMDVAPNIKGLGLAFHGDTLYASEPYESSADSRNKLSRLWRVADLGLGEQVPIVEGIPRDDHGVNQIQIVGDSLYVGIGVRTRNGAFQTWSGDSHGESAYGGTVAMIENLNHVANEPNSAGFYPANPDVTTYRQLIRGEHPASALPLTSTADNKLRVHSTGTRNPYGLAIDGDGVPWITNNWQRNENHVYNRDNIQSAEGDAFGNDGFQDDIHDQLFRTVTQADYGYRNGNWQQSAPATGSGFFLPEHRVASFTFDNYADPAVVTDRDDLHPAYNQDYDPDSSPGLGPSSSANGFDFYQSNAFPLSLHKDAFVARWNGSISDADDTITYRDVVSDDSTTGEVNRIAAGFRNPLDVVADGFGNLLVADYGGSLFRIAATQPATTAYGFRWDSDADGNWDDRLNWDADSLLVAERMVPDAWGDARYDVTIDRRLASPAPTVTLDRDVTVEQLSIRIGGLALGPAGRVDVTSGLNLTSGGTLSGHGAVQGNVNNTSGSLSPGDDGQSIGILTVTNYNQRLGFNGGTLAVEIDAERQADLLRVTERAILGGELNVTLAESLISALQRGDSHDFPILETSDGGREGIFFFLVTNGSRDDANYLLDGIFLTPQYDDHGVTLRLLKALPGDANGDGLFDSSDFVQVFARGGYEDGLEDNSEWRDGDWNGDADFTSADLVAAFQLGHYEAQAAFPVPEPWGTCQLLAGAIAGVLSLRRAKGAEREGAAVPKAYH